MDESVQANEAAEVEISTTEAADVTETTEAPAPVEEGEADGEDTAEEVVG